MYVRDLEGNEFALQVTSTNDLELNGNQTLSFQIQPVGPNELFIDNIAEMWEVVDHDDVKHKIVYCKKKGKGKRLTVDVKAIPLFFDKFDSDRIYEEYNEHMTAHRCFSLIFEDTGFNFILVDSFPAIQWQGFGGGDTRLKCFKDALNRYGAEFRLVGNTVYLEKQIGRDTDFMYRHRLNASNIVKEIDASALYTYAKGYGDYEDSEESEGGGWQNAKLIREYTSTLAQILGIRHAPPVKDGRIKDPETMDKKLKELVDNSLKISVSADIHDLRKQGYPLTQPELGDRVFLIDERIELNTEVRVVEMSVTKNWKGEVIDLKLTFGSPGLLRRYQSNLHTAISQINDLMEGRSKLPFSMLDEAVQMATRALQRAQTELIFENGIIARDKNNPNRLVLFNSEGIGISDDGGATFREAITADGIVADLITAGTMLADRIRGGQLTLGGMNNEAGIFRLLDEEDSEIIRMTKEGIQLSNGARIVGSQGILSVLQFVSSDQWNGWSEIGLIGGPSIEKGRCSVTIPVPENFVIEKAILTMEAMPVYFYDLTIGSTKWKQSRNLRLYRATGNNGYFDYPLPGHMAVVWRSGTNITDAVWGVSSWSPSISPSSAPVVQYRSGNIAQYLTPGQEITFYVETTDNPTQDNFNVNQGLGRLIVTIEGFSKPQ